MLMRKRIKIFLEILKFVENYQRFLRAIIKELIATESTEKREVLGENVVDFVLFLVFFVENLAMFDCIA